MAEVVTYIKNPYPVPEVNREGTWTRRPVLGKRVVPHDKAWSKELKAYERLFAHHTLNSIRKDHRLIRTKVPQDALDLSLAAVYKHTKDSLIPKSYVPIQPETLNRRTWRVLKNRIEIRSVPELPEEYHPKDALAVFLKRAECYPGPVPERRVHPSNIKLNITGPHSVQSNPGYSRKIDGTFYNI